MPLLLQMVSNRHILKTRPPKNKLVLCILEIGCYFPVVCNIFLYPKILITKTSIRWWLRNVSQSSFLFMLPKHHKIPYLNKARFRRRTSHEPSRMQMRENKGFCSFAFDSAHVKYGVWTWPKCRCSYQRDCHPLVSIERKNFDLDVNSVK